MKSKLPEQIQLTGYVADFLTRFADALTNGYQVVPNPYSPVALPNGLIMCTLALPTK